MEVTSGNIEFPTDSITHGNFFCKALTGPTIEVCAAVPAILAIAVFFVAANVFVYTDE